MLALFGETVAEIGFDVFQLRGTPVSVIPTLSITVAFSVVVVPVFTRMEVLGLFAAVTEIDWTGQV